MPGDTTGIERELTFVANPQKPLPADGSPNRLDSKRRKNEQFSGQFAADRSSLLLHW